jgi:hypothetical protein
MENARFMVKEMWLVGELFTNMQIYVEVIPKCAELMEKSIKNASSKNRHPKKTIVYENRRINYFTNNNGRFK